MKGSKSTDFTTGSGNDAYVLKLLTKDDAAVFTSLNGGEGADTLTFDTSFYALSDANKIRNMENINLINNSTLILDNALLPLGDDQLDVPGNGYHVESGSLLHVNNTNEVNFTSRLSGDGTVSVDTSAKVFISLTAVLRPRWILLFQYHRSFLAFSLR